MGKHAAPRRSRADRVDGADTRTPHPHEAARPGRQPISPLLVQLGAFGGLAVAVAVVALAWAGAGATTALAVGAGLLVLGAVGYLVLTRSGLLASRTPAPTDASASAPAQHP